MERERGEVGEGVNERESRLSQTDGRSEQQINYRKVEKREKASESGRRENEMERNRMKWRGECGWQSDTGRGRVILIWFAGKCVDSHTLTCVRACAHTYTHTASRVLDLQALFTSSDKVDVLETAGSSLVDKVLLKDSERLALGGRSMWAIL